MVLSVAIVSNTSPIINLAAIQQLHLLQQLYERITIPVAVYNEIVIQGAGQPGATEVQNEPWFEKRIVMSPIEVTNLLASHPLLNHAEAEAIILAVEIPAHLLLMDEAQGRRAATGLGVPVRGVLGVLIEAKQRNMIPFVKPLMDDLLSAAGFYVARPVYDQVLRVTGEA